MARQDTWKDQESTLTQHVKHISRSQVHLHLLLCPRGGKQEKQMDMIYKTSMTFSACELKHLQTENV